jgi:hypothetical protein
MVMGSSMLLLFYPGLGWTLARLPVLLLPQSSVAEAWIGVRISLYIAIGMAIIADYMFRALTLERTRSMLNLVSYCGLDQLL